MKLHSGRSIRLNCQTVHVHDHVSSPGNVAHERTDLQGAAHTASLMEAGTNIIDINFGFEEIVRKVFRESVGAVRRPQVQVLQPLGGSLVGSHMLIHGNASIFSNAEF
jgi:hypothetical protein